MRTLLVLEKDPLHQQMWRYLLEQRGLEFLVTGDEDRALDSCREDPPDVILADGETLKKGGRSMHLVEYLREAAPHALLIALWAGYAGPPVTIEPCRTADYNVLNNGDFAVLLRLLDTAIAKKQRENLLTTVH